MVPSARWKGMECPFCGYGDSRVVDSRPRGGGVRRRREPFSRDKVLAGVRKACEKRPIPTGAIEELVDKVERQVYALGRAEVPTSYIGDLVMEELRRLDRIAYIRFASVYRAFADVDELERELEALKAGWPRPEVPPGQLALLPRGGGQEERAEGWQRRRRASGARG
jgi:transcriptional repressor NrdR